MDVEGRDSYSPPKVDRIRGTWGSNSNLRKAIFYLLKGTIHGVHLNKDPRVLTHHIRNVGGACLWLLRPQN